jgi:hypothetical protein
MHVRVKQKLEVESGRLVQLAKGENPDRATEHNGNDHNTLLRIER